MTARAREEGGPSSSLLTECRVFSRYLSGEEPSAYVVNCYERVLTAALPREASGLPLIDRSLLALARAGTLPARVADSYARHFRPYGLLRRRLILLLAILENAPPTAAELNSARLGGRIAVMARLAGTLVASAACLAVGIVLLGPTHLVTRLGGGSASQ